MYVIMYKGRASRGKNQGGGGLLRFTSERKIEGIEKV
jgi:hypothetical protein